MENKIKSVKVAICFLDEEDNIIVKKPLETKWVSGIEKELEENYDVLMDNGYATILLRTVIQGLSLDLIKEMIIKLKEKIKEINK